MPASAPKNPFGTATYYVPEYICDRENEVQRLIVFVKNGNSVTLYFLRRLHKTYLNHHLFSVLPDEYRTVYVDITNTTNTKDFLDAMGTAVISQFP